MEVGAAQEVEVGAAEEVEVTMPCACSDQGVAAKAVARGETVAARGEKEALCILLRCILLPLLNLAGVQDKGLL